MLVVFCLFILVLFYLLFFKVKDNFDISILKTFTTDLELELLIESNEACPKLYNLWSSINEDGKQKIGDLSPEISMEFNRIDGLHFKMDIEKIFYNINDYVITNFDYYNRDSFWDTPSPSIREKEMITLNKKESNLPQITFNYKNKNNPLSTYSKKLFKTENYPVRSILEINHKVNQDVTEDNIIRFVNSCFDLITTGTIYVEEEEISPNISYDEMDNSNKNKLGKRSYKCICGLDSYFVIPDRILLQAYNEALEEPNNLQKQFTRAFCHKCKRNIRLVFNENDIDEFKDQDDYIPTENAVSAKSTDAYPNLFEVS